MSRLDCLCDDCGEILMATASGGFCPNGHGKVIPGVTRDDIARRLRQRECSKAREAACAEVAKLPLCSYIREASSWAVGDSEGAFRRVAGPYAASLLASLAETYKAAGRVLARTANGHWCVLKELRQRRRRSDE